MRYWLLKSDYEDENEFKGRPGIETWRTRKPPKDWAPGDRLFYWLKSPASRLVALAVLRGIRSRRNMYGETLFDVKRLTSIFKKPIQKQELLQVHSINQASFLKQGPAGTVYALTTPQGEALFRIAAEYNPEIKSIWKDIALQPSRDADQSQSQEAKRGALVEAAPPRPCIFIGHGRSPLWARLQIYLKEDLRLETVNYESESRAGDSIIPILERMLNQANFAVLLLTAEDETKSNDKRARQNVVHEAGLFQGRLGFRKAILLVQEGLEEFTNVAGLQYIPFAGDRIEQTFYELQRVLRREGLLP